MPEQNEVHNKPRDSAVAILEWMDSDISVME